MESIQVGATEVYSLLDFVGESIEARRRNRVNLLSELTPRLHAARRVELELDRHLARRFNVFKYLRTDELGLSRIIADLLDPTAEHGQGKLFLRAMLDAIPDTRYLSETIQELPNDSISVVIERQIERSRRIDISVDIRQMMGRTASHSKTNRLPVTNAIRSPTIWSFYPRPTKTDSCSSTCRRTSASPMNSAFGRQILIVGAATSG